MNEMMGDRPLSNTTDSGVDIGLEDEMTNASEEYSPEANQEDCSFTGKINFSCHMINPRRCYL